MKIKLPFLIILILGLFFLVFTVPLVQAFLTENIWYNTLSFLGIIEITNANHLNSDGVVVSDIYDEVKDLDEIWSETIPDGDYVRISFKKNLTSENDITLYPRIITGTPKIEVYEENGKEKIAEFASLNENQYNKVYLTNLIGKQDTFELKIIGGSVEFDYITDPVTSYVIFSEGFETGWEVVANQLCDSTPDCSQIGNFNGCDSNSGDFNFCSSTDTSPDISHSGLRGLITEDWDNGDSATTSGIWYSFNPSTACGGSFCDYITLDVWAYEINMDGAEPCRIAGDDDTLTNQDLISFTAPVDSYTNFAVNASDILDKTDTNWNIRILPYMNLASDDCYWDDFNITGYKESSDTCTCAGLNTNWEIDMADSCVISSTCNLGTGSITFIGTGTTTFNAAISTANLEYPTTGQTLFIGSSAIINVG